MKKLLLLFCALLCLGGSGAWAADIGWTVGSGAGVNFTVWALGLDFPGECTSGNIYSLKDFTITYRGDSNTQALYMAICTDNGINTGNDNAGIPYPATKVLAISDSPCSASASSCKYTFTKPVKMCAGVRYYAIFLTSNVPSDGNYTRKKQGIKVKAGTYSPTYINTYNTSALTDYMPIFTATLTNGIPISTTSGNYSDLTSNGNWASTWTSEGQAPTLKFYTSNKYIKVADGSIWTGGNPANCTYTISVPDGFQITGYSLTGKANLADNDQVITPADDDANPKTFTSSANNTVTISGIAKTSTTFKLSGNNKGLAISEFIVNVKVNPSIGTMVSTLKTNMETYKDLSGVGYPKADAAARTTLNAAYAVLNGYDGSTTNYTKAANYAGQLDAYNKYLKCSDIVMPIDGKVYKFTNIQKDNSTKQYVYAKDNHDLELNSTAVTDGTERFVCHAIDAANGIYSFVAVDGYYMVGATSSNGKAMSDTYTAAKQRCTIAKYTISGVTDEIAFGKVYIKYDQRVNNNGTAYLIAYKSGGWSGNGGLYISDTESSMFILDECSDYYNKVTLTSDGTDAYASLYLPFSVTIPEGITAYAVAIQDGTYAHMETIVTNGILPKEKAAILKKAGQTTTETIYLSPAEAAGELPDGYSNLLNGTVAENQAPSGGGTTYVLSNLDGIGLYEYEGEHLARGKAYLFVPSSSVKALTFDFGDADAIGSIASSQEPKVNSQIFNLAGQRLSKAQKGVNIVNGKKVLVK